MTLASGGPDTLQRNRNNVPDLLRTISVKVSVIDGKWSIAPDMGAVQRMDLGLYTVVSR